jgi:hypothetical protein
MAARRRASAKQAGDAEKSHDQTMRERIRTDRLVDRLTEHALGEIEMSSAQVSAALGLLRKSLPDLQSQTIHGNLNLNVEDLIERLDADAG